METLKIQVPEGFKIESFDEKTSTVKFAPLPKNIRERVKSFADVLKYNGLTCEAFENQVINLADDEKAYIQLKLIVRCFNEGWIPDWSNGEWDKWNPIFDMDDEGSSSASRFAFRDSVRWRSHSTVGSRLCFKSEELCDYAAELFLEIYRRFLTL